jgi:hypothetical protein
MCTLNTTSTTSTSPGCIGFDGKEVTTGNTETYYSELTSCSINQCPGTLSLIGLSYREEYIDQSNQKSPPACNGLKCIAPDANGNILPVDCSISNGASLFRVIRESSSTSSTGTSNRGLKTQIYNRSQDKCLTVDSTGLLPVLSSNCSSEWALIPALTNKQGIKSLQQIVYIGALTDEQVASITSSINDQDKLMSTILALQLKSLQLLEFGPTVLLTPFSTYNPSTDEPDYSFSGQYIDYTLFNSIIFGSESYSW